MSTESGKGSGVAIDVNAIYAQMQALAEEIERLRAVEAQMLASLESVRRAKDSVDAFVSLKEGTILIPLDPHFNGFAYVNIADSDRFIVSLGLGYYAEVDAAKALEVLSQKEKALTTQLSSLRETIREYADLYERYRQTLSAIIAQAQAARAAGRQ